MISKMSPREFSIAMQEQVEHAQRNPATAVSDQSYKMKLRILDHFVQRDPDPDSFEQALLERIADVDPRKELSRGVCCQILNSWRSGSCHYRTDGRFVLDALYPADPPASAQDSQE